MAGAARFPHPRGDGPTLLAAREALLEISPPAWGWPGSPSVIGPAAFDFPTRVGMARQHSPQPPTLVLRPRQVTRPGTGGEIEITTPAQTGCYRIAVKRDF